MSVATHSTIAPPTPSAPDPSVRRFAVDAWRVMWSNPGFLILSIGTQTAFNVLEPSMSLVIKRATDAIQKSQHHVVEAALAQAPLYLSLVLLLCILKLSSGFAKGVYDSSLVLALQRMYLQRRHRHDPPDDVSRMMFDCREAKTVLDPFHFDLWRNTPRLISVILWQYTLAPAWLPLLLIVTAPYLLAIVIFAPLQQGARAQMLVANSKVAQASVGNADDLRHHQRHLLRRWAWLHFWNGSMNAVMEWAAWPMLVVVLLCSRFISTKIVPATAELGELAVFAFNMSLIGLPVRELGMIYTKMRGNWPAFVRVMYPASNAADDDAIATTPVTKERNHESYPLSTTR